MNKFSENFMNKASTAKKCFMLYMTCFSTLFFHLEILFKQINKPPLIIRALSGKFELNIKFLAGYCIVRGRKGGGGRGFGYPVP
jgi:hypothetical protein